jgi:hypothetical protein
MSFQWFSAFQDDLQQNGSSCLAPTAAAAAEITAACRMFCVHIRIKWLSTQLALCYFVFKQAVPLQLFDVNGGPAGPNEHDQKQVRKMWVYQGHQGHSVSHVKHLMKSSSSNPAEERHA